MIVGKSAICFPFERCLHQIVEQTLWEGFLGKYSLTAFKDSVVSFPIVLLNEFVYLNGTLMGTMEKHFYKHKGHVVVPLMVS